MLYWIHIVAINSVTILMHLRFCYVLLLNWIKFTFCSELHSETPTLRQERSYSKFTVSSQIRIHFPKYTAFGLRSSRIWLGFTGRHHHHRRMPLVFKRQWVKTAITAMPLHYKLPPCPSSSYHKIGLKWDYSREGYGKQTPEERADSRSGLRNNKHQLQFLPLCLGSPRSAIRKISNLPLAPPRIPILRYGTIKTLLLMPLSRWN